MHAPILFVVDDEPDIANFVSHVGEACDYDVIAMNSGKEFQEAFSLLSPDLVIMDVSMPDIDAIGLLNWLSTLRNKVPIILMSGHGDYMLSWAKKEGTDLDVSVIGVLSKPIAVDYLKKVLTDIKVKLGK